MFARVSTYEVPGERAEEAIRAFTNATDALRSMDGAREALLLVDRNAGTAITITLWQSEEALRASEEAADRLRADASASAGGRIESVERYEVALHETFGG